MTGINHSSTPQIQTAPAADNPITEPLASPALAAASVTAPARGAIRHALCEIASGAAHFVQRLSPAQLVALIAGSQRACETKSEASTATPPASEDPACNLTGQLDSKSQFASLIDRMLDIAWAPIEFTQRAIERVSSWFAPTTSEVVFPRRRQLPAQFDLPETGLGVHVKPSTSPLAAIVNGEDLQPPSDKKKQAFVTALEQAAVEARYARKEAKEDAEARAEDEHRRKVARSRDRVLARDMQNGISNPRAAELANQLDGPFAATEDMVLAQIDDLNRAEQKERS